MKHLYQVKMLQMQASILELKVQAASLQIEPWMTGDQRRGSGGKFASKTGASVQEKPSELPTVLLGDKATSVKNALQVYNIDFEEALAASQRRRGNLAPEQIQKEIEKNHTRLNTNQKELSEINKFLQDHTTVHPQMRNKPSAEIAKKLERKGILEYENELLKKDLKRKEEKIKPVILKRMEELPEILAKEGKKSLRAQWRAKVIETEIKYGAILDKLEPAGGDGTVQPQLFGIDRARASKGYKQLITALTKPENLSGNFELLNSQDNLTLGSQFAIARQRPATPAKERPAILKESLLQANEFQKLMNVKLNVQIGLYTSRAHSLANPSVLPPSAGAFLLKNLAGLKFVKDKSMDGIVNIGDVLAHTPHKQYIYGYDTYSGAKEHIREITFHELGHLLEAKKGTQEMSAAFRGDRGSESSAEDKAKLKIDPRVMPESQLVRDKFFHPYVGLIYKDIFTKKDMNTEVISSGCEALGSPVLASRYTVADREALLYAISVIDMKKEK